MADSTLKRNMNDSAAVSGFFAKSINAVSIFLSSVSRVCRSTKQIVSTIPLRSSGALSNMALNSSAVVPLSMCMASCSLQPMITSSIFMT